MIRGCTIKYGYVYHEPYDTHQYLNNKFHHGHFVKKVMPYHATRPCTLFLPANHAEIKDGKWFSDVNIGLCF